MLLFILVLGFLLSRGATQAPGDESALCPQTYPDTWRVLMDSWRYLDLLNFYDAVWTERSVDGDQRTWGPGSGGLCRWSISSCFYALGTQNNWVFTQHISKDIPAGQPSNYPMKVYVNITYTPVNCASGCIQRFDAYRYIVNTPQTTATQKDTSRYSLLQGIHTSGSQEDLKVLELDLSQSQNGVYFAFRDPDTCITINRVIVYRKICPERQDGLVLYSERPAPSAQTRSFQASCVPNARQYPTSSLSVTCTYEGEWVGSPQCQCNGGYRSTGSACEACPAGTYSTNPPSTSCSSCPANTVTTEVAASICSCLDGFYRAPRETASSSCSSPPGPVQNLRVTGRATNSITLSWQKPTAPRRSDLKYIVTYHDACQVGVFQEFSVLNDRNFTGSTVTETVTGLIADTTYTIKVTTQNGVSQFDQDNEALREREILDTTQASRTSPGPPSGVQSIGTVIVWKEPENPNGKITGYRVKLTRGSSQRVVEKMANEPYYIFNSSDLPSGTAAPTVQVQATNSAGNGEWSSEVTVVDDHDQSDVSKCSANNGGCSHVCTDSFLCSCRSGYVLARDESSCNNINECDTNNGECSHTCTDTVGSFRCSCRNGYILASDGKSCNNINECNTNNGGCSQICTDTEGSFRCSCRSGYILASDGKSCINVNECNTNFGGCSQICIDTVGSFRCACRSGYVLASDGRSCNNINECDTNNGGCSHICTDTVGSFRCSCRSGHVLASDGKSCNNINECNTNNGGCSHTCTDTEGSFMCSCRNGYTLTSDGKSCVDVNECNTNFGGCSQICINSVGSFRCACGSGYVLASDGKSCNVVTVTTPTSATTSEPTSSSSCSSDFPPCDFATCHNIPHRICVIDGTGCEGACQVSSCRVCTAGEEFSTDGCEDSQCEDDYDDKCIESWARCVKRANRNIFVRPTASSTNCVPHPCL